MVASTHVFTCADCGRPRGTGDSGVGGKCAQCGSEAVAHQVSASDVAALSLDDEVRLKQRDPSLRSKDKLRKDTLIAHRKDRSGRNVVKRRVIDRNANSYLEHVEDKETGEVVHHDEGSLDGHTGHGSARPKRHDA
jgi:hypothetical protein